MSIPLTAGSDLLLSNEWPKLRQIVLGGLRRQDSVAHGIEATSSETEIILIHDGARPLVTPVLVEQVIASAASHGASLAGIPVTDTLKLVGPDDSILQTISRESVWAAQTPQAFQRTILMSAYQDAAAAGATFTDEAALLESVGQSVQIVPGDSSNIKVTMPADLRMAEFLLASRNERSHG